MDAEEKFLVVFEYTTQSRGRAFLRIATEYKDRESYESLYVPNVFQKVLASGLNSKEVGRFLLASPTICDFLSSIEMAFQSKPDQPPDQALLDVFLIASHQKIVTKLQARREHNHLYTPPVGLLSHLNFLATSGSLKAKYMFAFIKHYELEYDYINLHEAKQELKKLPIS